MRNDVPPARYGWGDDDQLVIVERQSKVFRVILRQFAYAEPVAQRVPLNRYEAAMLADFAS